jgi:Glycosyl transferase family 90
LDEILGANEIRHKANNTHSLGIFRTLGVAARDARTSLKMRQECSPPRAPERVLGIRDYVSLSEQILTKWAWYKCQSLLSYIHKRCDAKQRLVRRARLSDLWSRTASMLRIHPSISFTVSHNPSHPESFQQTDVGRIGPRPPRGLEEEISDHPSSPVRRILHKKSPQSRMAFSTPWNRTASWNLLILGLLCFSTVYLQYCSTSDARFLFADDEIRYNQMVLENSNVSLYANYQEVKDRSSRFPSVEERLKVYMSTWYLPPCNKILHGDQRIQYNILHNNATSKVVLIRPTGPWNYLGEQSDLVEPPLLLLDAIPQNTRIPFVLNHFLIQNCTDKFCFDTIKYFFPSLDRVSQPRSKLRNYNPLETVPIVLQYGDSEPYIIFAPEQNKHMYRPVIPLIKKFRYSMDAAELRRVTTPHIGQCNDASIERSTRLARTVRISLVGSSTPLFPQPIISIVSNYERHFNPLNDVVAADIPWNEKRNIAVYRGAFTGQNRPTHTKHRRPDNPINVSIEEELEEIEWCQEMPRCNLVLRYGQSQYVDAKLVANRLKPNHILPVLQNVSMFGNSMPIAELLQYKAIIILEGNDVATGLKWALFSNSVVLTTQPSCTSWAMEELLVPWVHYVPILSDSSDIEEKMQWILEHDTEAQEIARRGHLWMTDLVYHPDAKRENDWIIDETFRRYSKHFVPNPGLTLM